MDPLHAVRPSEPLTVLGLEVDSYMRLRAARLTPTPTGLVLVRGRNGQGKSSLMGSMGAAFCGAEEAQDLPITEGAHGAKVIAKLGSKNGLELVVKRTWKRGASGAAETKLAVENAEGLPQASPQRVMDALLGHFSDPVKFIGMKTQEQVQTVLEAIGLDAELRKLEEIADGWFAHRRDLGRDADKAAKAYAALSAEAGLFDVSTMGEPGEDVAGLAAELQAANAHNAHVASAVRAKAVAEERGRSADARVKRLRAELENAEAEVRAAGAEWTSASQFLTANAPVDTAPIVTRIRDHEATQQRRAKLDMAQRAKVEADAASAKHAEADKKLEQVRAAIAHLLGSAKFPIEGMSYDPEAKQLKVNGIPFSQASHAEKLRLSVAVAMAGSPRIRVMFIREGSMLDADSLALVARMAEEHGFQVWCEMVDSNPKGGGIWIEDGEAHKAESEPAIETPEPFPFMPTRG